MKLDLYSLNEKVKSIEDKIDKIKHCVVSLSRRDKFSIILRILTLNMIPIWHPQFSSATNVVLMIGSRKSFWGFGQIIIILWGGRTDNRTTRGKWKRLDFGCWRSINKEEKGSLLYIQYIQGDPKQRLAGIT